jgi:hypothetical protein
MLSRAVRVAAVPATMPLNTIATNSSCLVDAPVCAAQMLTAM